MSSFNAATATPVDPSTVLPDDRITGVINSSLSWFVIRAADLLTSLLNTLTGGNLTIDPSGNLTTNGTLTVSGGLASITEIGYVIGNVGSFTSGVRFGPVGHSSITRGSGDPNGVVPAPTSEIGCLYVRSDPTGPTTRLYINTDGGTSWVAITTSG